VAPRNSSLIIEKIRGCTYQCFAGQTDHPPAPAGAGTAIKGRNIGPLVGSVGREGATLPNDLGRVFADAPCGGVCGICIEADGRSTRRVTGKKRQVNK